MATDYETLIPSGIADQAIAAAEQASVALALGNVIRMGAGVRCRQVEGEFELAERLGFAADANRSELRLSRSEERALLLVLDDCPLELQSLKAALQANQHRARM